MRPLNLNPGGDLRSRAVASAVPTRSSMFRKSEPGLVQIEFALQFAHHFVVYLVLVSEKKNGRALDRADLPRKFSPPLVVLGTGAVFGRIGLLECAQPASLSAGQFIVERRELPGRVVAILFQIRQRGL